MLKKYLLILAEIAICNSAIGQDTKQKTTRLTDSVYEVYHVLKTNKTIKQGLFHALYGETIPVAAGNLDNDVKVGTWRFFDTRGHLLQVYNYDTKKLEYEAPEAAGSDFHYFADVTIDSTDIVTKPIKIGGRYYGFIPYLNLFKLPDDIWDINRIKYAAVVELLISPLGRLANYKVTILGKDGYERVINMNLKLPNQEDKIFIPAKKNGEPVACRIIINARITDIGRLDFATNNTGAP